MFTSILQVPKWASVVTTAAFALSLGSADALAAGPRPCRTGPLEKNLMALSTPPCSVRVEAPHQLTKREVQRLTKIAERAEDHFKLARYYTAKADNLDSQGAGYEKAATALRNGPVLKNLMAPNTAARYEFFAKGFREEARAARALAKSHEEMATTAMASL